MNRTSKTEMNDMLTHESQAATLRCCVTIFDGRDRWRPFLVLGTSSNVDLVVPMYLFRCAEQNPKRPMFTLLDLFVKLPSPFSN